MLTMRKFTGYALLAVLAGAIATGSAAWLVRTQSDARAATPPAAGGEGPPTISEHVQRAVDRGTTPLASDAAHQLRLIAAPDNPALPRIYAVPTRRGGVCLATSDEIISSCLEPDNVMPGTVTLVDDVVGEERPAYLYGATRPTVRSVTASLNGVDTPAIVGRGYYLLQLPAESSIDAVKTVTFVLASGERITRRVNA